MDNVHKTFFTTWYKMKGLTMTKLFWSRQKPQEDNVNNNFAILNTQAHSHTEAHAHTHTHTFQFVAQLVWFCAVMVMTFCQHPLTRTQFHLT